MRKLDNPLGILQTATATVTQNGMIFIVGTIFRYLYLTDRLIGLERIGAGVAMYAMVRGPVNRTRNLIIYLHTFTALLQCVA